jgi:hypothetical protein
MSDVVERFQELTEREIAECGRIRPVYSGNEIRFSTTISSSGLTYFFSAVLIFFVSLFISGFVFAFLAAAMKTLPSPWLPLLSAGAITFVAMRAVVRYRPSVTGFALDLMTRCLVIQRTQDTKTVPLSDIRYFLVTPQRVGEVLYAANAHVDTEQATHFYVYAQSSRGKVDLGLFGEAESHALAIARVLGHLCGTPVYELPKRGDMVLSPGLRQPDRDMLLRSSEGRAPEPTYLRPAPPAPPADPDSLLRPPSG